MKLEEEITLLLHRTNRVITTIPGIGEILGVVIISEIGDIHRFDAPGKLVAFTGLDVRVNQSGEFAGTKKRYPSEARLICGRQFALPLTVRHSVIRICRSISSHLNQEGNIT